MLTTEEFRAWCHRLQLSQDTAELIAAMRSSPPVRKVTGRAGNVAGRYPSPKMQHAIQFESQHVELWAVYAMERDDDVVEYYDQPVRMPARYHQTTAGQWRCPPGEAYAEPLGLTYRVRSSAEYHPVYIQNLKFLQDF